MAEGFAAILVHTGLGRGNDEGAVLDRPGPEQHFPVRLTRLAGKGRRRGQDLRAGNRFRTKQLGEADIIADAEAELAKGQVGHHGLVTGTVDRAFPPAFAIVEIDVEHVDLVIGADLAAVGSEQEGTIGDLAVCEQDGSGADMQMDAEFACKIPAGLDDDILVLVAQDGHQARAVLLHGAGHLRGLDIDRPVTGGFTHEAGHGGGVLFRVDAGAHLDGGSLEGHDLLFLTQPEGRRACRRGRAHAGRRSRRHGSRR